MGLRLPPQPPLPHPLILLVQFRRMWAAGGRHDVVFSQVERHLAVMVRIMPNDDGGQPDTRVWAGVRAFDGIEHVSCIHGAQRFTDCGKRVAQITQQSFLVFAGFGPPLSQASGGFWPSSSAANAKFAQATCLTCSANVRTWAGPNSGFSFFEFALSGPVAKFFLGHGFRGGPHFVFLILQTAQKGGGDAFLLAHFRSGGLTLWLSLFCEFRLGALRCRKSKREKGSSKRDG